MRPRKVLSRDSILDVNRRMSKTSSKTKQIFHVTQVLDSHRCSAPRHPEAELPTELHSQRQNPLRQVYLFILKETERESASGERAERGRERIPSRLRAGSTEPDAGLNPTNHEITT